MRLVALLTDYGNRDYYVGAVKAVIKGIAPQAEFVDVTHEVPPFDIREGAFLLLQASKYLPKGCIVLAVVDPGVNSKRLSIAVKTRKRVYVGPDNGLMYPAASREGIMAVYDIGRGKQVLSRSGTFAGRDIFAPAVAQLILGRPLSHLGGRVDGMKILDLSGATFTAKSVTGTVTHVDRFGNAVTNIDEQDFHSWRRGCSSFRMRIKGVTVPIWLVDSFEDIRGLGLIIGSSGAVEVAAKERDTGLGLESGETLLLEHV